MGDHAMDTLQSGLYGGGHRVLGLPFLGLTNSLAAYGNPGLSAASMAVLTGFTLGGGGRSPFGQSGVQFATFAPGGGGGMGGGAVLQVLILSMSTASSRPELEVSYWCPTCMKN
jgi:hypothetical protein